MSLECQIPEKDWVPHQSWPKKLSCYTVWGKSDWSWQNPPDVLGGQKRHCAKWMYVTAGLGMSSLLTSKEAGKDISTYIETNSAFASQISAWFSGEVRGVWILAPGFEPHNRHCCWRLKSFGHSLVFNELLVIGCLKCQCTRRDRAWRHIMYFLSHVCLWSQPIGDGQDTRKKKCSAATLPSRST